MAILFVNTNGNNIFDSHEKTRAWRVFLFLGVNSMSSQLLYIPSQKDAGVDVHTFQLLAM